MIFNWKNAILCVILMHFRTSYTDLTDSSMPTYEEEEDDPSNEEGKDYKTLYYKERAKRRELERNVSRLEQDLLDYNKTKIKLKYYENFATLVNLRNELTRFETHLPHDPSGTSRDNRTTRRDRYACCLNQSCPNLVRQNDALCAKLKSNLAANKTSEFEFVDGIVTAHCNLNKDIHMLQMWQKAGKNASDLLSSGPKPHLQFLRIETARKKRKIFNAINVVLKLQGVDVDWQEGLDIDTNSFNRGTINDASTVRINFG